MPTYSPNPDRAKIEEALVALAERVFANSEINSVLLAVSQYWNDEADDAVHHRLLYSTRHTPLFPHRCSWRPSDAEDFCGYCKPESISVPQYGALPWGDNSPDTIAAFEGYCREGCDQGMGDAEAYLPYAIVRRDGGFERIGRAVRSWAMRSPAAKASEPSARERELLAAIYASPGDDAPRAVLADWWLSREDPRGELVLLQLKADNSAQAKERERALIEAHGRSLFASISPAIHRDGAVLRRGLLAEAEVKFTSETPARELAKSPQWGTVERLHFLPGGEDLLPPSMGALSALSGLSKAALLEAVASGRTWPVEHLAVDFPIEDAARILAGKTCFPRLTRLEGTPGNIADLAQLSAILPSLVRQIGISSESDDQLPALLSTLPDDRELVWVSRPDQGRLSPWSFVFSRAGSGWKLRARLESLFGDASLLRVGAIRRRILGPVEIEIVPSRHYDPKPRDIDIAMSPADDPYGDDYGDDEDA